jgi:hypothetical protein
VDGITVVVDGVSVIERSATITVTAAVEVSLAPLVLFGELTVAAPVNDVCPAKPVFAATVTVSVAVPFAAKFAGSLHVTTVGEPTGVALQVQPAGPVKD